MRAEHQKNAIRFILGVSMISLGVGGLATYLAHKADQDHEKAVLKALQSQNSGSLSVDAWQTKIAPTATPIR